MAKYCSLGQTEENAKEEGKFLFSLHALRPVA